MSWPQQSDYVTIYVSARRHYGPPHAAGHGQHFPPDNHPPSGVHNLADRRDRHATYTEVRQAVALAAALHTLGVTDPTADDTPAMVWRDAAILANLPRVTPRVIAATLAILDVRYDRTHRRANREYRAYYTARKATLIARMFTQVGLTDARSATGYQWRLARLAARVEAPSTHTKAAVEAILDARG